MTEQQREHAGPDQAQPPMAGLSDQQTAAVCHENGPALVLAGPGSGKTTVIASRAAYLCGEKGVDPRSILTLTFSRAAAADMRERYDALFGAAPGEDGTPAGRIAFCTLHSFCNRIVRSYERLHGHTLRRLEAEGESACKEQILREIYLGINHTRISDDELDTLSGDIGLVKNRMVRSPDAYTSTVRNFRLIYRAYENFKKEKGYIDFDDMLTYAYRILRKCPDILAVYKKRSRYIQIDEGQDLTRIQFEILSLLTEKRRPNLFIVADDDQSVYGFRGAQPEQIRRFCETYDSCRVYRLEVNYRSSENIVRLSSRFIQGNGGRLDKHHHAENGAGPAPVVHTAEDAAGQYRYLVGRIREVRVRDPQATVGVLYRNSLSSFAAADALDRAGLSFVLRQSRPHFFSHWAVQDLLALLRFACDQTDAESFGRIYYKIGRYLSKSMIEYANRLPCKGSYIDSLLQHPNLQPYQQRTVEKMKTEFEELAALPPLKALDAAEEVFHYGEYMREFCEKTRTSYDYAYRFVAALRSVAQACGEDCRADDFLKRLGELKAVLHAGGTVEDALPGGEAVTLATMHSAKGLEFDAVFLIDLLDDEIPGPGLTEGGPAGDTALLEEERRLLYVGMTRARRYLWFLYPKTRGGMPGARSCFLNEVARCLDLPVQTQVCKGARVFHRRFGSGVVEQMTRHDGAMMLEIAFSDGNRTLDYDICKKNGLLSLE